jgi:hypothetical protein
MPEFDRLSTRVPIWGLVILMDQPGRASATTIASTAALMSWPNRAVMAS